MTTTLSRRAALVAVATVPAAAVTVIPAYAVAGAATGDDRLLYLIREYERELACIDAIDSPSRRRVNAWHRKAEALLSEASTLTCLSAASAAAVLTIIVRDDMLWESSVFSDEFTALVASVRDYLARQVTI
jgi:hypothetical protein